MARAARVSDRTSGTCDVGLDCCPHGRVGRCSRGSPNVFINGRAAHRLGDSIAISCPHGGSGVSTSASRSVYINGIRACRIGDSTVCVACGMGGAIVSASPNVYIGG